MWSLTDGTETTRVTRDEDVLSFAWSHDRRLLAISHVSGSVCLVDTMNGFRTLTETTLSEICGMITFSPDCRFLFCRSYVSSVDNCGTSSEEDRMSDCLSVNMQNRGHFSMDRYSGFVTSELCEPQSRSDGGFLLGDPICLYDDKPADFPLTDDSSSDFVLNKQFVLKNYPPNGVVEMLYRDEAMKSRSFSFWHGELRSIDALTFSANGDTVYAQGCDDCGRRRLTAWNVSSGKLKAEKVLYCVDVTNWWPSNLFAFRGGILSTSNRALDLWNFELTRPIHRWADVSGIPHPISDKLVACFGPSEVSILDTVTGDRMTTFKPPSGRVIACNSKCQLMTVDDSQRLLTLWQSETVRLWEERWQSSVPGELPFLWSFPGIFSRMDDFILILFDSVPRGPGLFVLDAVSGKMIHKLCKPTKCFKFVSNEECCVICPNWDRFGVSLLRLFNVRSGDLLCVLDIDVGLHSEPALATCPEKGLITVGSFFFKFRFKIFKLKLQGENNYSRKRKRLVVILRNCDCSFVLSNISTTSASL